MEAIDLNLMSGAMDKAKKEINMKNRVKQFRFLSFPLTPVSYTWEKHAFFNSQKNILFYVPVILQLCLGE